MKQITKCMILLVLVLTVSACTAPGASETAADSAATSGQDADGAESGEGQNSAVHSPAEAVGDWQAAKAYLTEGNQRFVSNQTMERTTNAEDRKALQEGQKPFAVIITCSDSRVSPEIYFDQKLGDIFVIRNAGNIIDETTLGSVEYAVEHLHAPLVVVVGHSSCGAVTGAFEGGEFPPNLQSIIEKIETSTENSSNLEDAIQKNISSGVTQVAEDEIIYESGTKVAGAYYNIASGEISWME